MVWILLGADRTFSDSVVAVARVALLSQWSSVAREGSSYWWVVFSVPTMLLLLTWKASIIASVFRRAEKEEKVVYRETDSSAKVRTMANMLPKGVIDITNPAVLFAMQGTELDADEMVGIASRSKGDSFLLSLNLSKQNPTMGDLCYLKEEIRRCEPALDPVLELSNIIENRIRQLTKEMKEVHSDLCHLINEFTLKSLEGPLNIIPLPLTDDIVEDTVVYYGPSILSPRGDAKLGINVPSLD